MHNNPYSNCRITLINETINRLVQGINCSLMFVDLISRVGPLGIQVPLLQCVARMHPAWYLTSGRKHWQIYKACVIAPFIVRIRNSMPSLFASCFLKL